MQSLFPLTIISIFPAFSAGAETVLDFLWGQILFDLCGVHGSPSCPERQWKEATALYHVEVPRK